VAHRRLAYSALVCLRNRNVAAHPKGQEILIGSAGFRGVALERKGTSEAEVSESTNRSVQGNPAMFDHFLEFDGASMPSWAAR
jgi:hypothetical protein